MKKEFPKIIKWNTLEQELEKFNIFNKMLFNMFIFYRKYTRRYDLIHEDSDINVISDINLEIEKVLNEISQCIDILLELKFYIEDYEIIEHLNEIVIECSAKTHPGLPFGIIDGGKNIENSILKYLNYFKKD